MHSTGLVKRAAWSLFEDTEVMERLRQLELDVMIRMPASWVRQAAIWAAITMPFAWCRL